MHAGAANAAMMRSYLGWMAGGGALAVLVILVLLAFLSVRGTLPAPQIANSQCIDEKLRAMRINPPSDPNLLVIGSSVAWRHFNGAAAQGIDPAIRPYNAGFCQANLRQTQSATQWLLDRFPGVRRVVLIASPRDFEGCANTPATQFDIADADRYVFAKAAAPLYYFKYFDPAAFLRNARGIGDARVDATGFDAMVVNSTGDGPSSPPWRGLHYGPVYPEKSCFAALRKLAKALDRRRVRLEVTITPMHPQWKARYGGGTYPGVLERNIRQALHGTQGHYHPQPLQPPAGSFYDAMHMRWEATDAYTAGLLRAISLEHSTYVVRASSADRIGPVNRLVM
jgi:hypothetical protein